MKRKIPLVKRRDSGKNTLHEIFKIINTNRGSEDPTIKLDDYGSTPKTGDALNDNITNDYLIEMIPVKTAIDDILLKEGMPKTAGGSLQFHFFRFVSLYNFTNNTNLGVISPEIFPQGYRVDGDGNLTKTPLVTIKKKGVTETPGVLNSTNATFESETATNIVAVGAKDADSYPKNYVKYQGEKDKLLLIPEWEYNKTYKLNQRVRFSEKVYSAKKTTIPHHSPALYKTEWNEIVTTTTINPSPLTKSKAQYWINATPGWLYANIVNSKKTAVVDMNAFLKVRRRRRTLVHTVTNDSANLSAFNLLKNQKPFEGMRVLVLGTGLHDFAGNDPYNKPKSNNIVIYKNGTWCVLPHWGITRTDDEVITIREGTCYTFNPKRSQREDNRFTGWKVGAYGTVTPDGSTIAFSSLKTFDCLHPVARHSNGKVKIENTQIIPGEDPDGNSAVTLEFDATQDRSMFAGANFFPGLWPGSDNTIPYGGTMNIGEIINKPVFDFFNMDTDKEGLHRTFGEEVEELLPIHGFAFWEKLEVRTILDALVWGGDFKMGLWLVDENDTVAIISYDHGHNGETENKTPKIGSYKIHHPVYAEPSIIAPDEPEKIGKFDWQKVWYGGVCTFDSYNEYGVYLDRVAWIETLFSQRNRFFDSTKLKLSLDMFRMTKPLVATNIDNNSKPDRNIETKFLRNEEIFSYPQLKNFVNIMAKFLRFKKKRIEPDTELRCNVKFGDPVYYTNPDMIAETTNSKNNTIQTVCHAVNYSVSKPGKEGPGGYKRNLELQTRLYPEDL